MLDSFTKLQRCNKLSYDCRKVGEIVDGGLRKQLGKAEAFVFLTAERVGLFKRDRYISGFVFTKVGKKWSLPICVSIVNLGQQWNSKKKDVLIPITDKNVLYKFLESGVIYFDPKGTQMNAFVMSGSGRKATLVTIPFHGARLEVSDTDNLRIYKPHTQSDLLHTLATNPESTLQCGKLWQLVSEKITDRVVEMIAVSKWNSPCKSKQLINSAHSTASSASTSSNTSNHMLELEVRNEYSFTPTENTALDFCFEPNQHVADYDDLIVQKQKAIINTM
mmetsp:Transcript_17436/g.29802  ORF Transcript_17436/g.29802 Transcript_17436/m.29802 type:complete len:277 (-) Transcript_17436:153-983(-)|eukprot:CAMPEP_0203755958 /NCGR_PEP_ID=MMETSP0098-20131031/9294_1 /ASSEMBLY_ACC=CAM_ASM_000208 /TAXON_ID=96639 /ORGANISM=" , Strain NY0313808BC1" /LENGTH=276 /DNA_ID=CAMNT_0050647609 /DNA_START=18 /DNA_END=848 /DNA_ORIENTATION=-